jgi:3',5'-cyclic-AMP phosphodiesterase
MRTHCITLIIAILSSSCGLVEYHPYEVRLKDEEKGLNKKAFAAINTLSNTKDTVSFILIGDTQRSYDQVESFVSSANATNHDFVVIAGDISDFGLMQEFRLVNDRLRKLKKPYAAVIGNHDFSGNGQRVFEEMYGPINDVFMVGEIKFILLNTNSREAGFNGRVPDLDLLASELDDPNYSQAIVISHIPPFDADFDPQLEERYKHLLAHETRARLSLHAHQHRFFADNYYDDHVSYMITTAIVERGYFLFKVWNTGYSYRKITY